LCTSKGPLAERIMALNLDICNIFLIKLILHRSVDHKAKKTKQAKQKSEIELFETRVKELSKVNPILGKQRWCYNIAWDFSNKHGRKII
jgi:hypothetical protein